jgi:hypothetical protein
MKVAVGDCLICDAAGVRGAEVQPASVVEPTAFVICMICAVLAVDTLIPGALTGIAALNASHELASRIVKP